MPDVYTHCPTLTGLTLTLRPVAMEDAEALLRVYGDETRIPFFNSDNCHGDNFHYATLERMRQAIRFWLDSYAHRYFVRWTVTAAGTPVGTVECFHRVAEDAYGGCALLRIDLRGGHGHRRSQRRVSGSADAPCEGAVPCRPRRHQGPARGRGAHRRAEGPGLRAGGRAADRP